MEIIDLDAWHYSQSENPELGMKNLIEKLTSIADGEELAVLVFKTHENYQTVEHQLILAPMSRLSINLK